MQAVFIIWLVTRHPGCYNEVADNPCDLAEEVPGYLFLAAMTATSLLHMHEFIFPPVPDGTH